MSTKELSKMVLQINIKTSATITRNSKTKEKTSRSKGTSKTTRETREDNLTKTPATETRTREINAMQAAEVAT